MQDAKEEVRARLNIEDVIGEYVQLKRAGRNFKGLSPFSGERTPSFFVSPDKHIWHDFSSGKGGDIFSFVMEVEGMDFRQALELLARRAGVDLSLYQNSGSQELAKRKKRLLEAHELAATYYQKSLLSNQHAVEYVFKKRGLNKKVVQDFRIGYAPDNPSALTDFLAKKGFNAEELKAAGLTNRFGGDLFRGRMMVSLMDGTGQVIGFTGRIIVDDPSAPKYLNTPQTLLYDKSRHVFGLSQAKEAIRKADYAVIVEGNLDVVSSHQAEITQVVATAGTALTESHLRALSRLSPNIKLAFDGDKAGLAATERAIPIAQTVGVELSIVSLPDSAKDPDELIQQDPALWQRAIDTSEPVVDWVIKQFAARENLSTAAGKRNFTTAALEVIRALHDPVEQDHYLTIVADLTDTTREALRRKLDQPGSTDTPKKQIRTATETSAPAEPFTPDRNQDALLATALGDVHVQDLFRDINITVFHGNERRAVAQYIATHIGKPVEDIPGQLQQYEKYVTMLLLHPDVDGVAWDANNRVATATEVLRSLQANYQKTDTKEELLQQEAAARERGDDALADQLLQQLSQLIKGEK
jgi:DNA primase